MKKLFDNANQYIQESDWKTLAALKICLLSLGLLLGIFIPPRHRKKVMIVCPIIFGATCVPLTLRFLNILFKPETEE